LEVPLVSGFHYTAVAAGLDSRRRIRMQLLRLAALRGEISANGAAVEKIPRAASKFAFSLCFQATPRNGKRARADTRGGRL